MIFVVDVIGEIPFSIPLCFVNMRGVKVAETGADVPGIFYHRFCEVQGLACEPHVMSLR